jgi:hypothetical protein
MRLLAKVMEATFLGVMETAHCRQAHVKVVNRPRTAAVRGPDERLRPLQIPAYAAGRSPRNIEDHFRSGAG